jgi:cell division septum initiation protein DivIVA
MSSKIELLIDEIEAYINSCTKVPFSSTDVRVNKDEINELIHELRSKTPDEIKRYQKIVSNKEAILNDARAKAQQLIENAQAQTNELINEHEIMRQAYEQANQVVSSAAKQAQALLDNATVEANNMKASAVQYTDTLLSEVEAILQGSIDSTNKHYEGLLTDLTNYAEMVKSNRAELVPPVQAQPAQAPEAAYAEQTPAQNTPVAAPGAETGLEDFDADLPLDAPVI